MSRFGNALNKLAQLILTRRPAQADAPGGSGSVSFSERARPRAQRCTQGETVGILEAVRSKDLAAPGTGALRSK